MDALVAVALLFIGWKLASFRGLPNVLIVMSVLIVAYAFGQERIVKGMMAGALKG